MKSKKLKTKTLYPSVNEFEVIEKLFPIKAYMRPSRTWWYGISPRLLQRRLLELSTNDGALKLRDILTDKSESELKTLRIVAGINEEIAASALRIAMVVNVTVPLALLALANQLLPGGIGEFVVNAMGGDSSDYITFLIGGTLGIIYLLIYGVYALSHLTQARDIRQLIDIYAAECGIYFGLEDNVGL